MARQFIIIVISLVFITNAKSQVSENSELFIQFKKQDSIFFERSFNQCDLTYLKTHITEDLKFYHDKGGFQDKQVFFENTKKYICGTAEQKPIRKLEPGSLSVYPLYTNRTLYGAIQSGIHHFYLRENGKEDLWTGTAKFTSVWVLEDKLWKLSTVLSYDHTEPVLKTEKTDSLIKQK